MFHLCISQALVQAELDEIFRRIKYAETPEIREHEANYAWFQIHGMIRMLKAGGLLSPALLENPDSAPHKEYEAVQLTLKAALKRAERVFDLYCDRPAKGERHPELPANP